MKDSYNREITGLRVSVTQKCNLKCFYCHNEGQEKNNDELSVDEIQRIIKIAKKIGIRKVKITGGEPLLRKDIIEIVRSISGYMDEVSMTTNGVLLEKYAAQLKKAGLSRVNISLDSLNPEAYKKITDKDYLTCILHGIKSAVKNNLRPVKINTVWMRGINENGLEEMIHFAYENNVILQVIEMETAKENENNLLYKKYHHDLLSVEKELKRKASRVEVRQMHHRKKYFLPFNGKEVQVEIVRPMHNSEFCKYCNRIRLTSDGKIKTCLFDKNGVDIISLIRDNETNDKLIEGFEKAIHIRKPYWC